MSKHRILLADDDMQTTTDLALALKDLGCEIITVNNGEQALTEISQAIPSLIIADWLLPGIDGLQLFTRLKNSTATRRVPFIFLTDCNDDEVRVSMLEIGVEDYWSKPFNHLEVAIRVRKILKRLDTEAYFLPGDRRIIFDRDALNKQYENLVINNRYKLLEQIGDGGMGLVFRAQELSNSRIVAIKMLRQEFVNQQAEERRFAREAAAAMRIRHPHVVETFEYGIAETGQAFIVMELLIGHSLEEELKVRKPLPLERALTILSQVAEAIAEAHCRKVIHRDIKPSNIHLIDNQHGRTMVKVLDFGIAWLNCNIDMERLTAPDVVMGTPHYLSPEQATGRPLDERSDIYGLGIVAYELLTGRPPFDGNSLSVMLAHLNVPPKPLKEMIEIDDWLNDLVMQMIAKDPEARPQSMQEIIDKLKQN